jgi:hypothetical protein
MPSKIAALPPDASSRLILDTLDAHGIAVLPGFVGGAELEGLCSEFEGLLRPEPAYGRVHAEGQEGITASIQRERLDESRFPATARFFSDWRMLALADAFYRGARHSFNKVIFVNRNNGVDAPVNALPFLPHFDKVQTLKFFVYLRDTTEANGAMGAALGSHKANRQEREETVARLGDHTKVDNVRRDAATEPVEGPAGTMFIFDTDMTHRAGHVRQGQVRDIMRGHTVLV